MSDSPRGLRWRGIAALGLWRVACGCRSAISTVMGRLRLWWWGVEGGRGARFFGRAYIIRHPAGRITMGDRCIFRSAEWSNSIGLNRSCFVSAAQGAEISIGSDSGFSGTVIAASQSISIGSRVLCGGNCTICDSDRHPLGMLARARAEAAITLPIVIEDDVFLGMNVVVLKGGVIGRGTVVAANSVVTGAIPAGVLAAGAPARMIRKLADEA